LGAIIAVLIWSFSPRKQSAAEGQAFTHESLGQFLSQMGYSMEQQTDTYNNRYHVLHVHRPTATFRVWLTLSPDKSNLLIGCSLYDIPQPIDDLSDRLFALLQANSTNEGAFFCGIPGTNNLLLQRVLENQPVTTTRLRTKLEGFVNALERTYT